MSSQNFNINFSMDIVILDVNYLKFYISIASQMYFIFKITEIWCILLGNFIVCRSNFMCRLTALPVMKSRQFVKTGLFVHEISNQPGICHRQPTADTMKMGNNHRLTKSVREQTHNWGKWETLNISCIWCI